MSDTLAPSKTTRPLPARPVSLLTIAFVFVLFAAGLIAARYLYRPATVSPQNAAAENLTKDLEWRATAESRRQALAELNRAQLGKISSYGWVDQKAGVVQIPIERAMELTVEKYGKKQQ